MGKAACTGRQETSGPTCGVAVSSIAPTAAHNFGREPLSTVNRQLFLRKLGGGAQNRSRTLHRPHMPPAAGGIPQIP